jgi:O-antigen/teichoic acid export membrane protein
LKKNAIFHNLIGSISNFVFLFISSIILLPYYFKFISEFEYGIWLGGISFLSLLSVLEANISLILTQKLGSKWVNNESQEFSRYLSSAIFIGVSVSILIITFAFFIKEDLYRWVSKNEITDFRFTNTFLIYSISIAITIVSGFFNCVTQVFLKTFWTPVFNFIGSIAGIILTIYFVSYYGVLALALGNLVRVIVSGFFTIIYVIKLLKENSIHYSFQFRYAFEFIKNISLPFVSKVGMTAATNLQNFIVAASLSASTTTIFDITRKLPVILIMVINMIIVSSFTSFSLFYSEARDNNDKHAFTNYYFSTMKIILLIGVFIVFLIGKEFTSAWVGIDKYGGDKLLALICLLGVGDLLRQIISQQYYAIGNFRLTSFAVSFMIGAYYLIPLYELYGIVLASILANIIYFVICYYLEKSSKITIVSSILDLNLVLDVGFLILFAIFYKGLILYFGFNLVTNFMIIMIFGLIPFFYFYFKNKVLFNFIKGIAVDTIRKK